MNIRIAFFVLCVFVFASLQSVAAGNKEHVHIKVHVPEIIKKHTHHRTIYKHHYKVKPKPKKPKKSHSHYRHDYDQEHDHVYYHDHDHDRVDPSVRHGTLHSRYQRPHWHDHQSAASHYHHEKRRPHEDSTSTESSGAVSSPEILSRWRQNFEILNRKPKKKTNTKRRKPSPTYPSIIDYSSPKTEGSISNFEDFDFNQKYFGDIQGQQFDHHIFRPLVDTHQEHPKFTTSFSYSEMPKQINPSLSDPYSVPTFGALHSSDSKAETKTEFSAPHLLKITEEDIRKRPKSTTSTTLESPEISFDSDSYANWKQFEWSTEGPASNVEHHYLRPTSSALRTMAEVVSQEEFMPFKHTSQYTHSLGHASDTRHETDDDDDDEVEPVMGSTQMDFGMPLSENMDPYETFTKRKNIKSGRNPMHAIN